jgi:A/G-specific adenine glycosylase
LGLQRWTFAFKMTTSPENVRAFRRSLRQWFRRHGRKLPWRRTRDPYAILVSEFMLQQTQVATVIPYYNKWLRRFPDFASVARASQNDILHAWQGLGYYNRARNLHAASKIVKDRYRGVFPADVVVIRKLPGVGRYTANAVATFALDQPVPIVETNIARLLARLIDLRVPIDSATGREKLWTSAAQLVPRRNAARFNSALIDLGALVCLPNKPQCNLCPVKKFCRAKKPETLPVKQSKPRTKRLVERHAFVVSNGRLLLEQSCARWRGMWILPQLSLDGLKPPTSRRRSVYNLVFPFTNHRVTLRIFRQRPPKTDNRSQRWFSIRRIESVPIPSPHRRAIADLLSARSPIRSRRPRL